jgi:2-C-methyl-D-erythritol 4-phosphate cytidylyltransferase
MPSPDPDLNAAHEPAAPARTAVVLLAAGEGRRVGAGRNKVLLPLGGAPVVAWSLRTVAALSLVETVVVVVREEDRAALEGAAAREHDAVRFVPGGDSRHASEWNALRALAPVIEAGEVDVVAIHDAARPLASPALWESVVRAAQVYGGALPTCTQHSLMARTPSGAPPGRLVSVQTPQAFRAGPLLAAYRAADADGFLGTDTASCVERYTDLTVHCVPSTARNLKITFPEDVSLAERLL